VTATNPEPLRDRLDAAKIVNDYEVLMRAGSISIKDGRIVHTKLTQQAIAAALGVPASHLSMLRAGKLRPSGQLALAIMGLLNANVNDYLLPPGQARDAA
jgi:predicted XRE-type DNA-binding protein